MTRINIGIPTQHLCDQHLVAEYRELPRMHPFAVARLAKYGSTGPRPTLPTLNAGHMAYFIPYGQWLQLRFIDLLCEMTHRGFTSTLMWREYSHQFADDIPEEHEMLAAPILQERIRLRLTGMKPRWTLRDPPAWVDPVPGSQVR